MFEAVDGLALQTNFCGINTTVRLNLSDATESGRETDLVNALARTFADGLPSDHPFELTIKIANVVDEMYFSNLTISNYRTWQVGRAPVGALRYRQRDAVDRGIEIVGDFNDRYAFNENVEYRSDRDTAKHVVERGIEETRRAVDLVRQQEW
jgi:hypothetical protein